MPAIQRQLSDLSLEAARRAQEGGALPDFALPPEAPISRAKNPVWGDYATALALSLARPAGRPPMEIAAAMVDHMPPSAMVGAASTSTPGFVNFTLSPDWVAAQVDAIVAAGPGYADLTDGAGRTAQVEFVSANPTGPLTVGHGRGGVIGDAVANLLQAVGYVVTREFYYNNAGRQMQRLGESLRCRYLQALGQAQELPEDGYHGQYLADMAADLVEERGAELREASWEVFSRLAEERIALGQRRTLEALGIRMDRFFNEQSLYEDGAVWAVLERLRAAGHVYDQDGAVWFRATALGGGEDRVVVRSNGEPTYRLPDIAYHEDKLRRGFDLVVDVLGADHKDAFPDVLRGLQALGHDPSRVRMLMNQFVTFRGERMSKRAGRFTTLDELVEEVGADVARFFLLMRAPETHLEFDLDLAREQSDTNPVFYVQYAHARLSSILRLAGERGFSPGGDVSLLMHPAEQALARRLLDLSDVLYLAAGELAPHLIAAYARDLAADFHAFYRDCRVLDQADRERSAARLQLTLAARVGLARALGLLGVTAPEEM